MAGRESNLVKQIKKYLADTFGADCWCTKTHGGYYGNNHLPDLTGCVRGRRFDIETKAPDGKPTPGQLSVIRKLQRAGSMAGVAYSIDDVKEILREVLENEGNKK